MATLESLQLAVSDVLQDNVFTPEKLITLFNRGIRLCAEKVLLPGLEVSGSINTALNTWEVEIPWDWLYSRNLYYCNSVDSTNGITVYNSLSAFLQKHPDFQIEQRIGCVESICLRGSYLTYYPIPAKISELTCGFYQIPFDLVNETDSPFIIPASMQEEILENYVLWKCYSELEDGIEGPKTNTKYYEDLFDVAIVELDSLIKFGQSWVRPTIENGWI